MANTTIYTLDLDTSKLVSKYRSAISDMEKAGVSTDITKGLTTALDKLEREYKKLANTGAAGFTDSKQIEAFKKKVEKLMTSFAGYEVQLGNVTTKLGEAKKAAEAVRKASANIFSKMGFEDAGAAADQLTQAEDKVVAMEDIVKRKIQERTEEVNRLKEAQEAAAEAAQRSIASSVTGEGQGKNGKKQNAFSVKAREDGRADEVLRVAQQAVAASASVEQAWSKVQAYIASLGDNGQGIFNRLSGSADILKNQMAQAFTNSSVEIEKERQATEQLSQAEASLAQITSVSKRERTAAAKEVTVAQQAVAASYQDSKANAEELRGAEQRVNSITLQTAGSARSTGQEFNEMATGLKSSAEQAEKSEVAFNSLKNRILTFFSATSVFTILRNQIRATYNDIKTLDKSFASIAMVTNNTVQGMWSTYNNYANMASKLGQKTNDVIQASALFYQQGLDQAEALDLTTDTMKLATLAGNDYQTATQEMTSALRGFKMEMDEGSHVTDIYSELAAHAAASVDDIAQAMSRTASIANSAGMSFENTSAFLTQMIETTQESAENIGTSLKTIIARFTELKENVAGTEDSEFEDLDYNKVDKALKSVGVSLKDTTGQFRNLDEVFLDLSAKWDSLDRNTQRYVATIAAGSRQQSRFIAMMDNYDRTVELMELAGDAEGKADEQFEKYADTMEYKLNQLSTTWEQFRVNLMESDFFKGLIDGVNEFVTRLNNLDIKLDNVFDIASLGTQLLIAFKSAKTLITNLFNNFGNTLGKNISTELSQTLRKSLSNVFPTQTTRQLNEYNKSLSGTERQLRALTAQMQSTTAGQRSNTQAIEANKQKQQELEKELHRQEAVLGRLKEDFGEESEFVERVEQAVKEYENQLEEVREEEQNLIEKNRELEETYRTGTTALENLQSEREREIQQIEELTQKQQEEQESAAQRVVRDKQMAETQTTLSSVFSAGTLAIQGYTSGLLTGTQALTGFFGSLGLVVAGLLKQAGATAISTLAEMAHNKTRGEAIISEERLAWATQVLAKQERGEAVSALEAAAARRIKTTAERGENASLTQLIGTTISATVAEYAFLWPILLIVAAAAALALAIAGTVVAYKKYQESMSRTSKGIKELKALQEEQAEVQEKLNETTSNYQTAKTDLSSFNELISKYEELSQKAVVTEEEQQQLKETAEELNSTYPNLIKSYDEATGAIEFYTGAIEGKRKALEAERDAAEGAWLEENAHNDALTVQTKEQEAATAQTLLQTKTLNGFQLAIKKVQEVWGYFVEQWKSGAQSIVDWFKKAWEALKRIPQSVANLIAKVIRMTGSLLSSIGSVLEKITGWITEFFTSMGEPIVNFLRSIGLTDAADAFGGFLESAGQKVDSFSKTVNNALESGAEKLEESAEAVEEYGGRALAVGAALATGNPLILGFSDTGVKQEVTSEDVKKLLTETESGEVLLQRLRTVDTSKSDEDIYADLAKQLTEESGDLYDIYVDWASRLQEAVEQEREKAITAGKERIANAIKDKDTNDYAAGVYDYYASMAADEVIKQGADIQAEGTWEQIQHKADEELAKSGREFDKILREQENASLEEIEALKKNTDKNDKVTLDALQYLADQRNETIAGIQQVNKTITAQELEGLAAEDLEAIKNASSAIAQQYGDQAREAISLGHSLQKNLDLTLPQMYNILSKDWSSVAATDVDDVIDEMMEDMTLSGQEAHDFIRRFVFDMEANNIIHLNGEIDFEGVEETLDTVYEGVDSIISKIDEIGADGSVDYSTYKEMAEQIEKMGLSAEDYFTIMSDGTIIANQEKLLGIYDDQFETEKQKLQAGIQNLALELALAKGTEGEAAAQEAYNQAINNYQEFLNRGMAQAKSLQIDLTERLTEAEDEYESKLESVTSAQENYNKAIDDYNKQLDTIAEKQQAVNKAIEEYNELIAGGNSLSYSEISQTVNFDARKQLNDQTIASAQKQLNGSLTAEEAASYNQVYVKSLADQYALLQMQANIQRAQIDDYLTEFMSRQFNYSTDAGGVSVSYSDFFKQSDGGLIQFDKDAAITAGVTPDLINDAVKEMEKLNDIVNSYGETLDEILEKEKEFNEMRENAVSVVADFQSKIAEQLKNAYQEEVDLLKEKYEAMEEENASYLEALQEALQKQRALQEDQNKWEELAEKEKKLSLMQRDTSGANAVEVQQLAEEVQKSREELLNDKIDSIVDQLEESYNLQQEMRDEEVEIKEALLSDNGYWNSLAEQTAEGLSSFDEYFELITSGNEEYLQMTADQQEQFRNQSLTDWQNYLVAHEQASLDFSEFMLSVEQERQNLEQEIIIDTQNVAIDAFTEIENSMREAMDNAQENINSAYDALAEAENKLVECADKINEAAEALQQAQGEAGVAAMTLDDVSEQINNIAARYDSLAKSADGAVERLKSDRIDEITKEIASLTHSLNAARIAQARISSPSLDDYVTNLEVRITGRQAELDSMTAFKEGGLVDFTGPAWVDGTADKPEAFLNAEDTQRIGEAARILADIPWMDRDTENSTVVTNNGGDVTVEINLNIDHISSETDIDEMLERVKQEIVDVARPAGTNTILQQQL